MTRWAVTMVAAIVAFGIRGGSGSWVVKVTVVVLGRIMVDIMMVVVKLTIAVIVVMVVVGQ